ncbi:Stress response protein NST1, partial [Clarias magur]
MCTHSSPSSCYTSRRGSLHRACECVLSGRTAQETELAELELTSPSPELEDPGILRAEPCDVSVERACLCGSVFLCMIAPPSSMYSTVILMQ